ncbi:MAG: phosphodiester glycosidase family protein [Candidatus Eisenbacteria bacterium]
MSRPLHARWILPFVVIVAIFALWQSARTLHWRTIKPGLEFATLRGEPFCRRGSSAIAVVRVDPRRVPVRARHYSRMRSDRPLSIVQWQHLTHADVVFNAGQYYPDFSYMGLLFSDGRAVSSRPHPSYKAALVAGPMTGGRSAHVIDMDRTPLDPRKPGWREIAQSFMLFDEHGGMRVRRSDRVANRTVVAEDERGHLVVIVSEGGYTLADFAELLRRSPLQLTHAMSMDGGLEAELVLHAPGFSYATFGDWKPGPAPTALGATVPLPAVITLGGE